ncbi:MAG: zinc ribbon domain-containing protein [Bacteroidaceae bacterium]|nr:zinc ribbon domain-containing protein [Bacteroidaceae bacterium]
MATFSTKKILYGSTSLIPTIANRIQDEFQHEGYDVSMDALSSGGYDISITKGGVFKAVLGMKTALKVSLIPQGGNIYLEAGVGIWGQQAIPTVISMLFFWPVLITQIWGMVEQSKLDDKVLDIAQNVILMEGNQKKETMEAGKSKFCPYCGTENPADAKFCIRDGQMLH